MVEAAFSRMAFYDGRALKMGFREDSSQYIYRQHKSILYYQALRDVGMIYSMLKAARAMVCEKSTEKEVVPHIYSNSARKNICVNYKCEWVDTTTDNYNKPNLEISYEEDVDLNEGINQVSGYTALTTYTNAYSITDYKFKVEVRIVINKVSMLVTIQNMMNYKEEEVKALDGEYSIDGEGGADLGHVWGFETIPQGDRQWTSRWLKQLFPQWNSSMGGPIDE